MQWKGVPKIENFQDFCKYHADGEPIYLVRGKLYAGFDMLAAIECQYGFPSARCRMDVEKAIQDNMDMFDVEETKRFYMPNDNMFSRSNAVSYICGQVLVLKEAYR